MVSENEVLFREDYFVATLPEYWHQVTQSPGYYQYRTTKGDENLSVSVFPSDIKEHERERIFDMFLRINVEKQKELSGSEIEMSQVVVKDQNGLRTAYYDGNQPDNSRRFAVLIALVDWMVIILHYEALDMDYPLFQELSDGVINRVKLIEFKV